MNEFDTNRCMARIQPEIENAAQRLRNKRNMRWQTIAFVLAAAAFAVMVAWGYRVEKLWIVPLCTMGVSLLFAPVIAYFMEEGKSYEE